MQKENVDEFLIRGPLLLSLHPLFLLRQHLKSIQVKGRLVFEMEYSVDLELRFNMKSFLFIFFSFIFF